MRKTYRLKCIHRDKKWDGDICTYTITNIRAGLAAIKEYIEKNNFQIKYLAHESLGEEATFILQGKKKNIELVIHNLLCDTDLPNYFRIEESV